MTKYLVVIEKTRSGYSAYSPDIDGCVATGKTKVSVTRTMREAIEFHLEGLTLEGYPLPKPQSASTHVGVRPPLRTSRLSQPRGSRVKRSTP
ncbi:MAG: type II toxin-antitoxin system HicB family antitoxin [Bacteroidota bacterium]